MFPSCRIITGFISEQGSRVPKMAKHSDDRTLLDRCKNGDQSAIEELVLKYQDRIYNLCRHMLHDPSNAEDAAQDTFIKACRNLKKFTPEASFYTWLYRIAVNTCLDYRKKTFLQSLFRSTDEKNTYLIEQMSSAPSPERLYESKQMGHALQKNLSLLSPKLRTVLVLKEIEGLSYEEIAEVLDTSIGTVKSRISRAREEFRKLINNFREQK
jgi:RNA polymerase sigma-70 factor, ECF subfamily